MRRRTLYICLVLAVSIVAIGLWRATRVRAAAETPPVTYLKSWSPKAAADYLDRREVWWQYWPAAQMVISRFGEQVLSTRWAGAGTFRDLLEGRENPGFAISALKPGYIYDPARHQLPIDGRPEELVGDPALNSLAYRVHQLTDTPYLTRSDYARVFRLTAEEMVKTLNS